MVKNWSLFYVLIDEEIFMPDMEEQYKESDELDLMR